MEGSSSWASKMLYCIHAGNDSMEWWDFFTASWFKLILYCFGKNIATFSRNTATEIILATNKFNCLQHGRKTNNPVLYFNDHYIMTNIDILIWNIKTKVFVIIENHPLCQKIYFSKYCESLWHLILELEYTIYMSESPV